MIVGLEAARCAGWSSVEIRFVSRLMVDISLKWLVIWKNNKWRKGSGARLSLPIGLLKRFDSLMTDMNVSVVHIGKRTKYFIGSILNN